jgi:hypothetical protein
MMRYISRSMRMTSLRIMAFLYIAVVVFPAPDAGAREHRKLPPYICQVYGFRGRELEGFASETDKSGFGERDGRNVSIECRKRANEYDMLPSEREEAQSSKARSIVPFQREGDVPNAAGR